MKELFIVPTPIGNLSDVSKNLIEKLSSAEIIFCEDTRVTGKLLSLLEIKKPKLFIYNAYSENSSDEKIKEIFENASRFVLVSDAGAPTISDPGFTLVKLARENNVKVTPISGPSSIVNFLMGSGVSYDSFTFEGFVPKKESLLDEILENRRDNELTIFFESPKRIKNTLEYFSKKVPKYNFVLGRELSKINEEFYFGTAEEIMNSVKEKGEIVFGFIKKEINEDYSADFIKITVNNYIDVDKLTKKEAIIKTAKKLKLNKNFVYKIYHD